MITPRYGHCLHCGAVEVEIYPPFGTKDFSPIGESANYPTGMSCEVCA